MSYQQRDNSGTLGSNRRKEKETHPSHTGQCTIDGVSYWISAWVKEGPTGKFFSLSFKPKDNGNAVASNKQPKQDDHQNDDFSDDIPF
jgi:cytochrome b involved in lipid metabolism